MMLIWSTKSTQKISIENTVFAQNTLLLEFKEEPKSENGAKSIIFSKKTKAVSNAKKRITKMTALHSKFAFAATVCFLNFSLSKITIFSEAEGLYIPSGN